jgi:hypothetical protein
MRILFACLAAFASLAFGGAAAAQAPSAPTQSAQPVTLEGYYRIKWGKAKQFKEMYERNHAPLLRELQSAGLITSIRIEEPLQHMAGGQRWDLRVTLVFRDAEVAVGVNGTFDKAWEAARKRLYPDKAKLDAEENERFSLLEEHWDVLVVAAGP